MFENINFVKFSDISRSKSVSLKAFSSKFNNDEVNRSNEDTEIVIRGHTSILYPPLSSDFSTEYAIKPQGFFLCSHLQGYYTRRENYRCYMLCYTISGSGVLEYEGKTFHLSAQDVFLIDCRKPQYYYANAEWKHIDLHFYGPFADDLYREFHASGSVVCSCSPHSTMIRKLEELARVWDTPQPYSALHISNKISDILVYLLTLSKAGRFTEIQMGTFAQITKYIEQNLSGSLSLERLASEASMSKYHFSRLFKKHTGLSPLQYIIQLRITRAKSMLSGSELSIRQIAHNAGFRDMNNFTNQFKKTEGVTPSEYRKRSQTMR